MFFYDTNHFNKIHIIQYLYKQKKAMYQVKGTIWIEGENGTFVVVGRITLMEKIREFGSISVAAKSMKMSYSHAWELIDSMNKQSKKPLIVTAAGGVGGGGTKVTKEGERVIDAFWELHNRFKKFNEKESKGLKV